MTRITISRLSPKKRVPEKITLLFADIQGIIQNHKWLFFGTKQFGCPSITEEMIDFYEKSHTLPKPCSECYKALIFWSNDYSEQNVTNFFTMMDSFSVPCRGKLNRGVVVFYFKKNFEMVDFIENLREAMNENHVAGTVQWRRACKEFQQLKPELWKNAKTFIPDNQK